MLAFLLSFVRFFFALLAGIFRRRQVENHAALPTLRVAVIGGGIAGSSAAWALKRGGCNSVTLFEKMPTVGGNARVCNWQTNPPVTTGLSVLAWPDRYFHNYNELLKTLNVDTTLVDLGFFIADEDQGVFAHARSSMLKDTLSPDLARWARMVGFVRKINYFFVGKTTSLYSFSIFNPLNVLSLRRLSRLFGVSSTFWNSVVVPIYSSTFLTAHLDTVPAAIVPVLHDLIPLDARARLRTWRENSTLVFERMLQGVAVETNSIIDKVAFMPLGTIQVHSEGGMREFDRVVFACSADAALKMMDQPNSLERALLGNIGYADDNDHSFLDGRIHSDASVLPECYREQLLSDFANYIEVANGSVENTFILSSWIPAVRANSANVRNTPMLVTYNSTRPIANVLGTVSNARAHPHMSPSNTAIVLLLRLIQGRRGVYYCGSFSTPGNGHDLSLLSGFAVAEALGAPYPFPANHAARNDFALLRGLMGF